MIHTVGIENTRIYVRTKGLFVLLAGRTISGEQGWDYTIISVGARASRNPGRMERDDCGDSKPQQRLNSACMGTEKRWTAARDRYTPPLSQTCGF